MTTKSGFKVKIEFWVDADPDHMGEVSAAEHFIGDIRSNLLAEAQQSDIAVEDFRMDHKHVRRRATGSEPSADSGRPSGMPVSSNREAAASEPARSVPRPGVSGTEVETPPHLRRTGTDDGRPSDVGDDNPF